MALSVGTRLGPYEILSQLGAGGMGEVYRARDSRLGREVAVKVLPAALASDPEHLRRFEQEARALGALNHPNILGVFDIGAQEGTAYVVSELLEGETLAGRLREGSLPVRKAIEISLQVASGLAAAHQKGILHRDLKPDNIFLTRDGRVEILDFGLAKQVAPRAGAQPATEMETLGPETSAGVVMGTVGYMSPEQVRGQAVDQRTDIFSFGAVLYEMLSGRRAFQGDSAVETMSAVLKEDPPELEPAGVPTPLERIVRRCLEKRPEDRFESARDLAFALEAISGTTTSTTRLAAAPLAPPRRRWVGPVLAVMGIAAALGAGFWAARQRYRAEAPLYRRITFHRERLGESRFAPDGQSVVYASFREGATSEIYVASPASPEPRALRLRDARLHAVSSTGELSLGVPVPGKRTRNLARVPLSGGAPREVVADVDISDWSPDGAQLAIVRDVPLDYRVEYPPGKVLLKTPYNIGSLRISPAGDRICYTQQGGVSHSVGVVDRAGNHRLLSDGWKRVAGCVWHPSGTEIWFSASQRAIADSLYAVDLAGNLRLVARFPGTMVLTDIARDGRLLIEQTELRIALIVAGPDDQVGRDLSWLDTSLLSALSADGQTILFSEIGEGAGEGFSVYLRKADGSPPMRLSDGAGVALSPDGTAAIVMRRKPKEELVIVPTGVGEPQVLSAPGLKVRAAWWHPDGKSFILAGSEGAQPLRDYRLEAPGAKPQPFGPSVPFSGGSVSPDGKHGITRGPKGGWLLFPLPSGEPETLKGIQGGETVSGWANDHRSVYTFRSREYPLRIHQVDVFTGARKLRRELSPAGGLGTGGVSTLLITPDGRTVAFNIQRIPGTLYVAEGFK